MKGELENARTAIGAGDLAAAERHLRSAASRDVAEALRYIREKELLFLPKAAEVRVALREVVERVIAEQDRDGLLLQATLPYLAYTTIAATIRDDIAHEAGEVADVVSRLPLQTSIELCMIAVVRLMRRYIEAVQSAEAQTDGTELTPTASLVPSRLVDAVWELGGINDLLPLMLIEVAAARRRGTGRSVNIGTAARAAQMLAAIAEDWQLLTDVRQRLAWGRDTVSTVEPEYDVYIAPADAMREWHYLAAWRRRALVHVGRQSTVDEPFALFIAPYVEPLCDFVADQSPAFPRSNTLLQQTLAGLASSITFGDLILLEVLARTDDVGGLARSLLSAYLLRYLYSFTRTSFCRGRTTYLPHWLRDDVIACIAQSADAPPDTASQALSLITWSPHRHAKPGYDHQHTPYITLDDDRLGLILTPGIQIAPFTEVRRALAATNRLSQAVGTAYEEYVRYLIRHAGFEVAPAAVKLRRNGQTLTDIDVLGYKDGTVLVCQAKHILEPDSHHGRWKARLELAKGVRQCLVARDALRDDSELVASIFSGAGASPAEIFCLTVTPAIEFGGERTGDVAIVDDAYLEHVVHIGATRIVDIRTGETESSTPLYADTVPTAQEFCTLMSKPAFTSYYRGAPHLTATVTTIRHANFVKYRIADSLSGGR